MEKENETKIEVTEEMIEAGASVLCGFHTLFADEGAWAREIYLAMETARRVSIRRAATTPRSSEYSTMVGAQSDRPSARPGLT